MPTLPDNLNSARLCALLHSQAQWLVQQQPKRAQDNLEAITQIYQRVNQHVQQQLQQQLAMDWPDIPFSSTEFDPAQQTKITSPMYWACDPIDGAVQYLSGLPLWTISLCLVVNNQAELAVVSYPAEDCTYSAQRNKGAYCNGERLHVANRKQLELAMLGTSFPNYPQRPQTEIDDFLAHLSRVIPKVLAQRWMGPASLTLSQLAAGMLDGYWETGRSLHDWLPGMLIAQEAGARISDLQGGSLDWNSRGILVASPHIYSQLAGLLSGKQENAA